MVDWKVKINREKGKTFKNNFTANMLFNEFSTTLPGDPVSKKKHHLDGSVVKTPSLTN